MGISLHGIMEQYYQEDYHTQEALPQNMYAEMNDKFQDFLYATGINKNSFKIERTGRYCFSEEDAEFIKEKILRNYTKKGAPVFLLREHRYDDIKWEFYIELEHFIDNTMHSCGKSDDQIEKQIIQFRHKTKWIYRYDTVKMKLCSLKEIDRIYDLAVDTGSLGNDDRLLIFEQMRMEYVQYIHPFFDKWKEIVFEFKEIREEEITDINSEDLDGLVIAIEIKDKIQEALNTDKELLELQPKLNKLADINKVGSQRERDIIISQIAIRERLIREGVYEQMDLPPELIKRLDYIENCKKSSQEILSNLLSNS